MLDHINSTPLRRIAVMVLLIPILIAVVVAHVAGGYIAAFEDIRDNLPRLLRNTWKDRDGS